MSAYLVRRRFNGDWFVQGPGVKENFGRHGEHLARALADRLNATTTKESA